VDWSEGGDNWFQGGNFDAGAFVTVLLASALALIVMFGLTFALARRLGKHSVVDVAWGLGFVVVAWTAFVLLLVRDRDTIVWDESGNPLRQLVLTAMVTLWGLRLAWHIARRNAGHGEDPRYEALLAKQPPEKRTGYALRMIYGLQLVLVLFIALPVLSGMTFSGVNVDEHSIDPYMGFPQELRLGVVAWTGGVVWAVGLFFEAVGDWQLKRFKADPANKGKVMDRGLWRYTRHPNYFGDACVWWGIWLVAAETGIGVFTILSPIVMTLFLTRGSGAALTERRMAGRPGFEDYVARTSGFLPLPPKRP
jgi:steroid 5-alpha reductase family enzyme